MAGNAVIVVATESHQKSLLQRLQEHEVNITAAMEEGRYLPLDVAETLATFMVNELPDPGVLAEGAKIQFSSSFAEASRGHRQKDEIRARDASTSFLSSR